MKFELAYYDVAEQHVSHNDTVTLIIGLVGKVFANGPGGLGSITGRVIPKTLKIILDTSLLNTQ